MTLTSIFALALAVAVLAITPGPGVFAIVARALSSGLKSALLMLCGLVTGDIIYVIVAAFGLSYIAQSLGPFFLFVKWAGSAYLIWTGIQLWRKSPAECIESEKKIKAVKSRYYLSGMAVTLSNPKAIFFYCGFLPTFFDFSKLSLADISILIGVVAVVVFSVVAGYAVLASRAQGFFQNRKSRLILNRTAGSVMAATGVTIALRSQ